MSEEPFGELQSDPDMEAIANGLRVAAESGLEVEFVWSLVNEIRANPNIETRVAAWHAMNEWDM